MKLKSRKMHRVSSLLSINENNSNFSKFESYNTTNKLFNKTISHTSSITKVNTNSSNQKDFINMRQKLNKCFDIDIIDNNNNILYGSKSKINIYRNNSFLTDDFKNNSKFFHSSYLKYKRTNINNFLLNEITTFENTRNNFFLRKNGFKKSYSKNSLIDYNTDSNLNMFMNHYQTIEKHRNNIFNQEIKNVFNDIKTELYNQNKKIIYDYSQKNIITPYKLIAKNNHNSPYINDENTYKLNIFAQSKILNAKDIQNKNNFLNYKKYENMRRSSSLKNLNLITNNKTSKYISDNYYNNKITRPDIKIDKYKSKKLHEIYDSLKN